jgi:hypothetical protein
VAQRKEQPQVIQISPDEWNLIRRYFGIARDVVERYARDSEDSRATAEVFRAFEVRFKKRLDEALEHIERIERLLTVERPGEFGAAEAREIKSEIRQELSSLQWQLQRRISNINYLEEQAASYGSMPPLWLVNQIADEQVQIQRLQDRLKKNDD